VRKLCADLTDFFAFRQKALHYPAFANHPAPGMAGATWEEAPDASTPALIIRQAGDKKPALRLKRPW
jgi:hypothetical protein